MKLDHSKAQRTLLVGLVAMVAGLALGAVLEGPVVTASGLALIGLGAIAFLVGLAWLITHPVRRRA